MKFFQATIISLFVLVSTFTLRGQDIHQTSPVNLPLSGQTAYNVASGQTVNISSSSSVTLGPGVVLSTGSSVRITIDQPPVLSDAAIDLARNWILRRNYDEDGNEIGASKVFYDNSGNLIQSQTKNKSAGNVLASQVIYDIQGRPVITTLSAPINNSSLAFKTGFVTTNGVDYNYTNFDGDPSSANPYSKINNPDALDNTSPGTLGWYYSNNNNMELQVAATSYPYSRADYYRDGTGIVKRQSGIGEQLKMGMGHENMQNQLPVINELNHYNTIRNLFYPSSVVGASPSTMTGHALQKIDTDPNGSQILTVSDLAGKVLMTGRADPVGWLSIQNNVTLTAAEVPQYGFYVNNYKGVPNFSGINDITNFSVNSANPITVYCNGCGQSLIYQGEGNKFTQAGIPSGQGFYVVSAYPFTITGSNGIINEYDQSTARMTEATSATISYFQLTSPSPVTINGSYTLYDMKQDVDITASFSSGSQLAAGYYKVSAVNSTASGNTVNISYTNKFSDINYNYYNQLGQLIANIAPNGVQQLLANPNNYNINSAVPFSTRYEYDLQGHLIAATSPDGGKTNYVYRQDGKLRFSQNAKQALAANAGPGNMEKFSYVNYDQLGRPIETGEHVVPNGATFTFAYVKGSVSSQQNVDTNGGLSDGTALDQVFIYYDLPATNLSLSGYIQDAGFLKGEVSYTSNSNCTTWYNYDDHGRVAWIVKQLTGLTGYKTIEYSYDGLGNVTRIDYQKGKPEERFVHYYGYNADGKLINVQTSRDDINKTQQANYYYYLHGPLKRVELGDHLQGIDYTYTPQGWLKAINHPSGDATKDPHQDGVNNSFAEDAFGMQLEYFPGDYSRSGMSISPIATQQNTYYDGNVNGLSWQTHKPQSVLTATTVTNNPSMYTYTYDAKYQLTNAYGGTPNFTSATFANGNIFNEGGISYDPNGNIQSITRTNMTGGNADNFNSYQYQAGTNKLLSAGASGGTTPYGAYMYDEIGELKSVQQQLSTGTIKGYYLKYDVRGKITGIYSDAALTQLIVAYNYDESGNRISRVQNTGSQASTTYYVYDAGGNSLAIYTGTTPTISEILFYGADRLGTYAVASANYVYELRDNVGSVRSTINRAKNSGGQADVLNYNNYYPFGSIAQSGGTTYSYDYQGAYAEKDPVTGYNNFDLRMYDGRIGRWLSVDPMGQYASPYEGMGNNPVVRSDPDGGVDDILLDADGNEIDRIVNDKPDRYFTSNPNGNFNWTTSRNGIVTSSFKISQVASQGGYWSNLDWKGIGDATIGMLGGTGEIATASATEVGSEGLSTAVSVPLAIDGWGRVGTNFNRLAAYFGGNKALGDALPSNIGGYVGKTVDIFSGVGLYSTGNAQAILGGTNDLLLMISPWGNAGAWKSVLETPNLWNTVGLGVSYYGGIIGFKNDVQSLPKR